MLCRGRVFLYLAVLMLLAASDPELFGEARGEYVSAMENDHVKIGIICNVTNLP